MIRPKELFLVAAIGLFWGLNWPAVKTILSEVPPWTLRAIGLSIGAILLVGLARFAGQSMQAGKKELCWLAAAGLFTVFGFNLLAAFGQLFTSTSTATIVAFTMPMWAMLFSALFLSDAITLPRLGSLLVGLTGLGVLVSGDLEAILARPVGVLLMMGAAISWAIGTVILKARPWTIAPLARSAWLVSFAALPMIVGAFLFEAPATLERPSPTVLLVFAYHIIFPMVVCHAAWVTLVDSLPVPVAAIGTLLIPIVGVLSSALLLGEDISATKLIALTLVLTSIILTFLKRREKQV